MRRLKEPDRANLLLYRTVAPSLDNFQRTITINDENGISAVLGRHIGALPYLIGI